MLRHGLVIKISSDYAIVATDESDFLKISLKDNMRIGQKIYVNESDLIRIENKEQKRTYKKAMYAVASIAAAILIAILITNPFTNIVVTPYAVISLDINPSFEMKINSKFEVIEVSALNSDGQQILESSFNGLPLDVAVEELIKDVNDAGYVSDENAILVSTVDFDNNIDEKINKFVFNGIKKAISENPQLKDTKVIFIIADTDDLKEAENIDLSVGKYKLYELSDDQMDDEIVANTNVSDLIKSPEIEEDLKTDKDIQIITGEEIERINNMEEDIHELDESIEQIEDLLSDEQLIEFEEALDQIELLENRFNDKDEEIEELYDAIEDLKKVIEDYKEELEEELDFEEEDEDLDFEEENEDLDFEEEDEDLDFEEEDEDLDFEEEDEDLDFEEEEEEEDLDFEEEDEELDFEEDDEDLDFEEDDDDLNFEEEDEDLDFEEEDEDLNFEEEDEDLNFEEEDEDLDFEEDEEEFDEDDESEFEEDEDFDDA